MAQKKKETRKYKPLDEFRYNMSPISNGHINYVFGETKTKFKSMGLTHTPNDDVKHIRLRSNTNPRDLKPSHLQPKVQTVKKSYYSDQLENWRFSEVDMNIVRHYKKQYKKSYNRKSPGYYENKCKNKKK